MSSSVTDDGLYELRTLGCLRDLRLRDSGVTVDGIRRFLRASAAIHPPDGGSAAPMTLLVPGLSPAEIQSLHREFPSVRIL